MVKTQIVKRSLKAVRTGGGQDTDSKEEVWKQLGQEVVKTQIVKRKFGSSQDRRWSRHR